MATDSTSRNRLHAVTEIPQVQCEALIALYNSTDGANWTNNTGWNVTNTPCSWYGVTCSAGQVTGIYLGNNNLNGPIPSELGNLNQLTILNLGGVADDIFNSNNGQLFTNALTGTIPAELENLSQLTSLDLYGNKQYDDNDQIFLVYPTT